MMLLPLCMLLLLGAIWLFHLAGVSTQKTVAVASEEVIVSNAMCNAQTRSSALTSGHAGPR